MGVAGVVFDWTRSTVGNLCRLLALIAIGYQAYHIRLHSVHTYGKVIHEFDPYFNFRATEYAVFANPAVHAVSASITRVRFWYVCPCEHRYLAKHGWSKFINWYDDRSWYPLGRPVGTTIYPGIQVSSVFIHDMLNKYIGYKMSLNDVCVYVPAWFSVLACLALFGLTKEVSKSANAGV
jgi:dolichyl-diphosphooligosaccharide--protein glycosyltransferase